MESFKGRCQCGKHRYRVAGETVALFVCHCSECQRQSSSAFGMALCLRNFTTETTGENLGVWARKTPLGQKLVGEYCESCGTRLFHRMAGQTEVMSIKPGTLETTRKLQPVAHIWTSSAQSWMQIPESTLSYPENPPNFERIFAAWKARSRRVESSTSQDPPGDVV